MGTLGLIAVAILTGLSQGAVSVNKNMTYKQKQDAYKTSNEAFNKALDKWERDYDKKNGLSLNRKHKRAVTDRL